VRASERSVALAVTVVAGLALVALAALLVPWDPVTGGSPAPVAADEVFTAEQIARAEAFSRTSRLLSWSSLAVSLVVVGVLGFTRWGRRLVERLPGPWWLQVVLAVAAVELLGRLVTLPFAALLHDHYVEAGLSTQGWGAWAGDLAKGQAVAIAVTSLVLWFVVGSARWWSRVWPLVSAGVLGGLVFLGSFAYPVVVEPLFNDFEPMPDTALRGEILALADTEGVEVDEVLVADASRRTTTLNAYVSGLWGSRRVVVYDTLLEELPDEQALSVVAHELSHARHDDVLVGTSLGAVGTAFGVGLLGLLVGSRLNRSRSGMAQASVVPFVLALLALGSVLAAPVQNGVSRQIETRSDVDALKATGDPVAFVEMQRTLNLRALADPTPPGWAHLWFGSHPTVLERVAVARDQQVTATGRRTGR
jgi:STE24 endopeptidase